jgi:outer membrane receptor protein involved in Fe transport
MTFARAVGFGLLAATALCSAALAQDEVVERIIVTAIQPERLEPTPGGQILLPDAAVPAGLPSLGDLLARRGASITVSEPQGNPFQPELSYRGYSVSGLLGLPQGLALYQNGVRTNEAFGDVVNFDVVPEVAIDSVTVTSGANPLFGLNALGGAVSATMKSGFTFDETALEISGGSFGRIMASAESGGAQGDWGYYAAVTGMEEDGWRNHSPSEVVQAFGDFARRFSGGEVGVSLTYADSDLNGNGAAPFDLLEVDREAVFTYPDNTRNELLFLQARGDFTLAPRLRLESVAFARFADQATLNGDETDIDECEDEDFEDLLCEEDGEGEPVEDLDGNTIEEDDVGEEPFAVFNRSSTESDTYGAAVQLVVSGVVGGLFKELIVGGDVSIANADFERGTELGELTEDRTVNPAGVLLGDDEFNTVLKTETQNWSAFGAAAFGLSDDLTLTVSGRYISTDIEMDDELGDDLDGDHEFDRFNPAVELAWRPDVDFGRLLVFGRYGESSRTPTPAELSCADPDEPCRFPNAFVADPPLDQVVAKTFELGVATELHAAGGSLGLSATAFSAKNEDDIIFVSSGPVVGSGYFRNVEETKREGFEASARWTIDRLTLTGSWTYVQATFEDSFTLLAEDNPLSNEDGEIFVAPGDRLPLIPAQSGRFSASYAVSDRVDLEGGVLVSGDRVFRGDEGNDGETLDGFARLDLGAGADVTSRLRAFLRVENVLDEEYETFGTYGDVGELFLQEAPGADDPRFLTPAAPRAVFVGVRLTL